MLEIYADESSISNNRYRVIGGVVIKSDSGEFVREQFAGLYARFQLNAEIKWQRIHRSHYIAYRSIVDKTFELIDGNRMHFHAVIVDSHGIRGDRDLGHSKFVYQLLLKFGITYASSDDLAVYLDDGKEYLGAEEFRSLLNNGIAKRWGINTRPFKILRYIPSKSERILHANDLLIGAISHAKNERHLNLEAREEKARIVQHVQHRGRIRNLGENYNRPKNRISIWNFLLDKNYKPPISR